MSTVERFIGCVNWFDSKKGYGFISVKTPDTDNTNKDIFVHFTSLNVDNNYKKIYPGEYVEFNIEEKENGLCCTNVSGIYRGKLLIDNENHKYKIYPKVQRDDSPDADGVNDDEVNAVADEDSSA